MASAWGNSWGKAWGNSWGSISTFDFGGVYADFWRKKWKKVSLILNIKIFVLIFEILRLP